MTYQEPQALIVSFATLQDICAKQVVLDRHICEDKGITPHEFQYDLHTKREISLLVEAGEMINETKTFKYWSNKRMDPEKVLEEAIDWLHFYCSLLMTDFKESQHYHQYDLAVYDRQSYERNDETLDGLYLKMFQGQRKHNMLAAWSLILERLGYTETDIIGMYEQKNAENYKRILEAY